MITRRLFLATGTGSLVSLGLPFTAAANLLSDAPVSLTIDPRIGAKCDIFKGGQLVANLKLVRLDKPFSAEPKLDQFILNFESTIPVNLPEDTYQISHPTLGQLELFLQPCGNFSGDRHDGLEYTACMAMLS